MKYIVYFLLSIVLISCGSSKPEPNLAAPKIVVRIIIDSDVFKKVSSRSPIDEDTLDTITIQFFEGEELYSEFDFPYSDHKAEITEVPEGTYTIKGIVRDKDTKVVLEGKKDNVELINGETTQVDLELKEVEEDGEGEEEETEEKEKPAPPEITSYPDITKQTKISLQGTKEKDTSILLNNEEVVPVDENEEWTIEISFNEGENTLSFTSKKGEVESDPTEITIICDTTSPSAPSDLTATSGDTQITLNWTSVSEAVSYNIYYDTDAGTPYANSTTSSTNSKTITDLTNGTTYYFLVTALDEAGNESGYSDEVNASPSAPDTTPPTESNWNPVNGSTIGTTSPTITFDLNENGDCKWSLTDQAYGDMPGDCTGDGTTSIICEVSGLSEGDNTVFISCKDVLGNADTTDTNDDLSYTVDATPPVQSAWSPASGSTLTTTSTTVTLTLNENGDCKWSLTDQAYGDMIGDCTGDNSTNISCAVSGLSEGANTVSISCKDTLGNADTAATNDELSYTVDTIPPTAPTGLTATPGDNEIVLTWDPVSDADSYTIYYDTDTTNPPYDYSVTSTTNGASLSGLTNLTTYYITVTALDIAGNESSSSNEISSTPSGTPSDFLLPDTGQISCYDNSSSITCTSPGEVFYGQDACYDINPMSLTDNGDGTVSDNLTGLVWEQKTTTNSSDTYAWQEAIDYCEALTLAGYDDWSLPDKYELQSIVDYEVYNPAIDTAYFPNTESSDYWSSSTGAHYADGAWGVYFGSGSVDGYSKSGYKYARCVR